MTRIIISDKRLEFTSVIEDMYLWKLLWDRLKYDEDVNDYIIKIEEKE